MDKQSDDKQSDFVNPKSLEECGSHAHTDDEFEEEMLSEEEPYDEGSSDEESAEEITSGEELDDEDSCAEGLNEEDSEEELEEVLEEELEEVLEEELEEVLEEELEEVLDEELEALEEDEDASVEEINEEESSKVLKEKLNGKEVLRCSMDQVSPVNDSDDVPSLLEEKQASDAVVDVPSVAGKRRRGGWDVKAEDVVLVNVSGELGEKSETRLCAGELVKESGEESYEEDSDEELEEAFEEYSEDDDSVEEANEEEINKESTNSCSVDQLLPANKPPNLLEQEKVSAAGADVPRVSSKRRPSRWDIKAEDLVLVNDGGELAKREIRWSSDIMVESSTPMKDSADLNKRRKTRWSSDKSQLSTPRVPKIRSSRKVEKSLQWLEMKLQLVNNNLEHYVTAKANLEKQTSSTQTIDDVHLMKLLGERDRFVSNISRINEERKKSKLSRYSFMFKQLVALPTKEYSRDNLVGLLLGPRGSTIRKIEEKTGTSMSLRDKDGFHRRNISKYDNICMMIKADHPESIDAAISMMEDLLLQKKRIKTAQLRELAKIKGTSKGGKTDFKWTRCDICGDLYHPAASCPLVATDSETVKKFNTGSGSLFSSYCEKEKRETQIMPAEHINCMPPDKKLAVGIAAISPASPPASPNANLPSHPGLAVVPSSFPNMNLPKYPRFAVPPSTSTVNVSSYRELAAISPSLNANLPSYPTLPSSSASVIPSSSHANLPNFPRVADPSSSNSNVPKFPGHAAILPSSSNANLPCYLRPAPCPPTSMNLNLPSYSINVPLTSSPSTAKPPNYTGHVAIPPSPINHGPVVLPSSSLNTNLSTCPVPPVVPPTSSKVNLQSYPALNAVLPSSNANLPSFPTPSSYINLSSYPKFAANPPSSNANIPSYPRFTAPSPSNSNLSSYTGIAAIPPPSNAKPPSYPKSTAISPSSNINLSSYTGLAAVFPSFSNANLPSCIGLTAIPQENPESNSWPGPPGSLLTEPNSSFLKGGYNSPIQTGSEPLETSTSVGGNAHILDRKKPVPTGTPPSLSPNISKHLEFAVTSREIAVPNCWPRPTVPTLPESGTSFPKNSYNSVKYSETMLLQSLTPPGSTGQHSTFSSQFPGITGISKERTSFPGYTGLADVCPSSSKVNIPSYPALTAISKTSSNANLSSDTELAAVPWKLPLSNNWPAISQEISEGNFWPRPTATIFPETGNSLPKSINSSLKHSEIKPLPSSAPLGSTGQTTVSSPQLPTAVPNEVATFPGYPKRIDASNPFDRPVPPNSFSSQPLHFTSNFSSNLMNPARRNYNSPASN